MQARIIHIKISLERGVIRKLNMATKSRGYLQVHETVELTLRGLTVWAYTKRGKFLGRVDINRAGLAASVGKKGNKVLGNMSWETFFERLDKNA